MKTKFFLLLIIGLFLNQANYAQVFFVDAKKGNDTGNGMIDNTFRSISKAVDVANEIANAKSISIKVLPGLYVLNDKIEINAKAALNGENSFTIEAFVMPNDTDWIPEKMPTIVSYSENNSTVQFPHAAGFMISRNNVRIKGLKFIGNPNPDVPFYYPVTRGDTLLTGLEISQCFFVAEKNSASIQGGIWAHGQQININHCVFYNCRNAVLLMRNINGCSITCNLIYGASESAVWIGGNDSNLVFKNNVIGKCDFFLVKGIKSTIGYEISDCVITGNTHYFGKWDSSRQQVVEVSENNIFENNITKVGKVELVERTAPKFPYRYLHLTEESAGADLKAGIFIDE